MKLCLPIIATLAFGLLRRANALLYKTYDQPFPDCTNNASACDSNSNYPHCVQCSPDLALCSADQEGCGCAIPNHMNRGNNQGSYINDGEQFFTRIFCLQGAAADGGDHKARHIYLCRNGELQLLKGFFAPCFAPNSTCVDTGLEGEAGGPTCTTGSGSVATYVGRAVILIATFCSIVLLI